MCCSFTSTYCAGQKHSSLLSPQLHLHLAARCCFFIWCCMSHPCCVFMYVFPSAFCQSCKEIEKSLCGESVLLCRRFKLSTGCSRLWTRWKCNWHANTSSAQSLAVTKMGQPGPQHPPLSRSHLHNQLQPMCQRT